MAYQQDRYQYPQGTFQPLSNATTPSPPQSQPYLPQIAPKPEQQNVPFGNGDATPQGEGRQKFNLRELIKKNPWMFVLGVVILAAVIALGIERDRIANAIVPHRAAIKRVPAIWLAPIGILIVLSIPPLFGHEVVLLLVGLIWGYGEGFGIAIAGTFIGELLNFVGFKYLFRKGAVKFSERNDFYGHSLS